MKKKTYIYRGFERFWHWSQALLIFFLALTGFEIHGTYEIFGFENVVMWHDIAAVALMVLIVFTIFWHFVTGEKPIIYDMAQTSYYVATRENDQAPGGYEHSGAFILVDNYRRIRGVYDGTKEEAVDKLINDIKTLLIEVNE